MNEKDHTNYDKGKKHNIIITGLIVHFLLLFAVFDIYFSSPLDHGMKLIRSTSSPPAKRLVLFVADGLRAEAVYGKNADRIPFLTGIVKKNGSWGTTHTRVPTESRPGHVAMLAGIFEDPSAIMKGWKSNPADFDSVLNQSTNAWCWGSPDILNIFNKDNLPHIRLDSYDAGIEDFGENDTTVLDNWVFRKVENFLKADVDRCIKDCSKFMASGNVFFLHLLGIDTAGHGFKPHSKEYIKNIRFVDQNVMKMYNLFESVFLDHLTTYVFTSDHGMTDWGSHGAGSSHETEAPVIAWGAGINVNPEKRDIKQVDVAPLLSTVIGINFPSNSLGVVPLSYLDMSEPHLAEIQLSNTLQLLETFNVKRLRTADNAILFIPFKHLTTATLNDRLSRLMEMQKAKQYRIVIKECEEFMETLIAGLDYYHNYYQYPLLISISCGFLEWILILVAFSVDSKSRKHNLKKHEKVMILIMYIIPISFCYKQKFPLSYYFHFCFPFVMFSLLYSQLANLSKAAEYFVRHIRKDKGLNILIYFIGIELLVFGFFRRSSFSILTLLIGLWVFMSESLRKFTTNEDKSFWLVLCTVLSIFPLMPVMKTTFNVTFYTLGSFSWMLLFYLLFRGLRYQTRIQNTTVNYTIFYSQFICLVLASIYGLCLEVGLINNTSNWKYLSWFILAVPISLIPFTNKSVTVRLTATFFGFAPFYVLVSSNYEAFFSAVYVAVLCKWLLMESKTFQASNSSSLIYYVNFDSYTSKEKINSDIYRRAFLFMVFILVGFFGTGNIASLNSFDPMWVRAFLTVFSPFKMMGLILLKIMVPFLFACCVFRAINSIGRENILQMFCIILSFSDLMVLQFLYLITNKGSWMDIGSSLSHFVIMEGFVTILLLLYSFAHILTTIKYVKR